MEVETPDVVADGADGSKAKDGTLLTDGVTTEDTTPLAEGDTPELPHAWMNGLTAEQKADADLVTALSKFEKGIPDITKAYVEQEAKLAQALVVPSEEASDEEKAAYRKAIGVPEKPEDYTLNGAKLPEGFEVDKEMEAEYLAKAHELNLSEAQAKEIHSWYMNTLGPQLEAARKVVQTTMDEASVAMRQRHRADPEAAKNYLARGFEVFASEGLATLFKTTGIGNHPDMIDAAIKIGKLVSEHPFVDGSRGERMETTPIGQRSDAEIGATMYPSTK